MQNEAAAKEYLRSRILQSIRGYFYFTGGAQSQERYSAAFLVSRDTYIEISRGITKKYIVTSHTSIFTLGNNNSWSALGNSNSCWFASRRARAVIFQQSLKEFAWMV